MKKTNKNIQLWISKQIITYESKKEILPLPKQAPPLLKELLTWHTLWGSNILPLLKMIRILEQKEEQFLKKRKDQQQGTLFQFLFLAVFIMFFSFSLYRSHFVGKEMISFQTLLYLGSCMIGGVLCFLLVSHTLYKKIVSFYTSYISSLFAVAAFFHSSRKTLPPEIFFFLKRPPPKSLKSLHKELISLLVMATSEGQRGVCELMGLLEELCFLREEAFENLLSKGQIMKVLFMLIFFTLPYFYLIFSLFSSLMNSFSL